jgi:Ca-activated chloride channel family protein
MPRHRRKCSIPLGVLLSVTSVLFVAIPQTINAPANSTDLYTVKVPVDEVSLTFHAADFHGVPMDNLKLNDLRVLDNGKKPRKIASFEVHQNLPVRFGVLMDTSRSMLGYVGYNASIVESFLAHQFNAHNDQAFLMRFDFQSEVRQDWTNDPASIIAALQKITAGYQSRLGGTALFDSIYKACRNQFGTLEPFAGNFILLFTDGIDNASHARLEDDIDICQQANTAIYIFHPQPQSIFSDGQKTLTKLATQTGGIIFFNQPPKDVSDDLRIINANLRSQYRLVYKPERLKRDGSFHRIKLDSPTRGGVITVRSGYYAVP